MKVIDDCLLAEFRAKGRCEYCGKKRPTDPHHLWCRGMGGGGRLDIKENLIALCRECHTDVHNGVIHRSELVEMVAKRIGLFTEDIENLIRDYRGKGKSWPDSPEPS